MSDISIIPTNRLYKVYEGEDPIGVYRAVALQVLTTGSKVYVDPVFGNFLDNKYDKYTFTILED